MNPKVKSKTSLNEIYRPTFDQILSSHVLSYTSYSPLKLFSFWTTMDNACLANTSMARLSQNRRNLKALYSRKQKDRMVWWWWSVRRRNFLQSVSTWKVIVLFVASRNSIVGIAHDCFSWSGKFVIVYCWQP